MIKSPETGLLHLATAPTKTKYLQKGEIIAQIYPKLDRDTNLHVTYYIPAENITGIKVDQKVRFTVNQNVTKPLVLNGQIIKIGTAPVNNKQVHFMFAKLI
ncbi:HlyD family efflux transporter periplasmic adaptor subunit [Leuconostoc citreum]|uniref:HlyD family efflux transporter periplasmic adaptor subunit n=1 Tax=Leuconostoc citreum TaxID=33964 RepID=UPI000BFEEFB2|nr:HlyD family efflux transporter periplasmic adaptor subunit [Leuconostoc citreum]